MAEIRTVTTLHRKRDERRRTIVAYEERRSQAKADLTHISAAITVFEGAGETRQTGPTVDLHRMFAYRELMDICKKALADYGPMDTRELAPHILKAKNLNEGDKVLAKAIGDKIIHPITQQWRRGKLATVGKRKGVLAFAP